MSDLSVRSRPMVGHSTPLAEDVDLERQLETHRRELTGYCYRMLGSGFEAEDAVQETMLRAWRAIDSFEGRAAFRSWVYRIATNVCLDMLRGRPRRACPVDMGPSAPADIGHLGAMLPENLWVSPVQDSRVLMNESDPAELAVRGETIRLAFVAALQHLPARQRAVLILREVLRWPAIEVAELLETSVPSVNSALQRARSTMASHPVEPGQMDPADPDLRALLARYVDAFERYDMARLASLLREDAIQSMPPYAMWIRGRDEIIRWLLGPGIGCQDSRLLPTAANGCPAFGQYRIDPEGGHAPWGLQVIETSGAGISGFHTFLDPNLFSAFGLPDHLDD
jgi:RNA polymerase sigma-70 factor (ECF subfamily)